MTTGSAGEAAVSAAGAVVQAIKGSGAIVNLAPNDFLALISRCSSPLVVMAKGKFSSTKYQYLTSYKGIAFFTKSPAPLDLPMDVERIIADKMWLPR